MRIVTLLLCVCLLLSAGCLSREEAMRRDLKEIKELRTEREAYEAEQRRVDQWLERQTRPDR